MKSKTIWIAGASGYLGAALASHLKSRGHSVLGISRHKPVKNSQGGQDFEMENYEILSSKSESEPHFLLNLANSYHPGWGNLSEMMAANLQFPLSLVDYCKDRQVKLIQARSYFEFLTTERQEVAPYVWAKKSAACLLNQATTVFGMAYQELVIFDLYGPRDPRPKIMNLLRDHFGSKTREPLVLQSADQKVPLVHVLDAVKGIEAALDSDLHRHSIAPGEILTVSEIVAEFERFYRHSETLSFLGRPPNSIELARDYGVPPPNWHPAVGIAAGVLSMTS